MSKRKTKTKAQQKNRKNKFQQKTKTTNNQIKAMQQAYLNQAIERQEIMKRANIIEQIYKAKPEFSKLVDNKLVLNDETVVDKEGVLYWVKDNNPIMAGLDLFENYNKYNKDFVNQVLSVVQKQEEQIKALQTTEVDLDGFDLVEDDNFEIVEEVESESESESESEIKTEIKTETVVEEEVEVKPKAKRKPRVKKVESGNESESESVDSSK
jgi:hypothetical protein